MTRPQTLRRLLLVATTFMLSAPSSGCGEDEPETTTISGTNEDATEGGTVGTDGTTGSTTSAGVDEEEPEADARQAEDRGAAAPTTRR